MLSGKAELTPDDGSPLVTIGAGDYVVFHQGFACTWQMIEPMAKRYKNSQNLPLIYPIYAITSGWGDFDTNLHCGRYCYFDENGDETVSNSIGCDLCSEDCTAECAHFHSFSLTFAHFCSVSPRFYLVSPCHLGSLWCIE